MPAISLSNARRPTDLLIVAAREEIPVRSEHATLSFWVTYEEALGEQHDTRTELSPRELRDLTAQPIDLDAVCAQLMDNAAANGSTQA